ncbi:MAG: sigma-70 family RNA polymerase sigma factor [Planctomycetes bacterium]|nr:sigma-70 family RNA polymerase sigma factor [Planctomycetota bacterium]
MGTQPPGRTAEAKDGPSPGGSTGACRSEPAAILESWVDEHADYLFRYALPRLRDRHVAEEVLQETFLAALKSVGKFRGDSSPRTWLVGLMRRKIADHYRKRYREGEGQSIDATDPTIDAWFDEKGSWLAGPKQCELDPAVLQERTDFWNVLQGCLQTLPDRLAEAFTLRVVDDRKPDEVCKVLSITPTNLWVALHQARARLRACLEANWFQSDAGKGR